MSRVAALLAAALFAAGSAGCGGGGAEPGAPDGATLVLDFTPNAVHSGIYAGRQQGFYRDAGVELTIREPGESTDAPKLLEAGRADFAILDIHDLGIAREHGLDLVGVMPIVQRPLASVLARADGGVRRPRELEGHTVGVTGLPSDEAVVDSEVSADGGDPAAVHRVTIGFNAVSSLAAGKVDAATGFWNAEGVALRERGVPIRIFKVNEYGAPPYPELVLSTARRTIEDEPDLVDAVVKATTRGYAFAVQHPGQALEDLVRSVPTLNRAEQSAQLRVLLPDLLPAPFDRRVLRAWAEWDLEHGLLERRLAVSKAFRLDSGG
jgi:NitT/TauT family transport system substrate-binding protein/putative hydroxymethylpyrimidine transport system substrate-binding protein